MADLKITFLGMQFPNPFVLASGPPTANAQMVMDAFAKGWGGAVLKTIGQVTTRNPSPRIQVIHQERVKLGMINIELISERGLADWKDDIIKIRSSYPKHPLIASIMGGSNPDDWQEVVHRLEPCGISAFEMNVSCPNFISKKGSQLGQDPESLGKAIHWVREATYLPVIVKLTPNVTDIIQLAEVAKESGADAVTAINTLSGLGGIDLQTLHPQPSAGSLGTFGGYSGPGLKPVALRCAASIAQKVSIPLLGSGGISAWQDAAEFMAAGCSLVEICTAVMWNGYAIIHQFLHGLSNYLEQHQFASSAELVGKALPFLVQHPDLNLDARLLAQVNLKECTGCSLCIQACASGASRAIYRKNKKIAIDPSRCDGCGLCLEICPTNAIRMIPCNN